MSSTESQSQRFANAHARLATVSVTGTNGKTTTTSMVAAIVAASGQIDARLTTLGAWVGGEKIESSSGPTQFLATVETAAKRGVQTLALETTSKSLAGGHARSWSPTVAVFTNFTRDHLDMHGSAEAYLAAKAQLFLHLVPGGVAVLNGCDPASELIEAAMAQAGVVRRVRRFAMDASAVREPVDLAAIHIEPSLHGSTVRLAASPLAEALGGQLTLRAVGEVHVANALAAALATDTLGYSAEAIQRGLANFVGVAGRFEVVSERPAVVVDYAHTPDGLEGTLRTARRLVPPGGRLVCVFGCGGDRDAGKRPQMGAIADALACHVVLTSDNPRRESPSAIADHVLSGVPTPAATWSVELDRERAIFVAIANASESDLVVVAGKGHEAVQEIAGVSRPFDDAEVVRRAVLARASQ